MITNVLPVEELSALARRKKQTTVRKTISVDQLGAVESDGWKQIGRKRKKSVRVVKSKSVPVLLEDRVWTSLYGMGFSMLSGEGGSRLQLDPKDPKSPSNQVDVVAIDQDIIIAVECKSSLEPKKDPRFQEEIAKHSTLREPLARAAATQFPSAERRKVILAVFTSNLQLSENDRKRAENLNVALFDETDLGYYEALTRQVGPAARYQFLCDLIPGKPVPGLEVTIPALKTKMGGYDCFIFSAHPEYLLKVCYVSHRAKGKASDIDAYQRMVSRSRLSKIRQYIAEDGMFPTNIVVSFQDPTSLRFDKAKQEAADDGSQYGWLHIAPTYKSAWVIDGQHRLFAYSGQPRATESVLPVLAFSGLPASEQAELFIDINGEQRRVKKSLLQELFAELHWSSSDPRDRIAAVVSKAIQQLDEEPESPFFGRVLRADESRNPRRCVSLTTIFRALDKTGFYVNKTRKGDITEYGTLWAVENEATLRRTKNVINGWFERTLLKVPDWWDLGSAEGGGLAMNDGVTICINVLRSVLLHFDEKSSHLGELTDKEIVERLNPYADALGEYLKALGPEGRLKFRQLRGAQGQLRGSFTCLAGIKQSIPSFNPRGLQDFINTENARTTEQARDLVDAIERTLQRAILQELRQEYEGEDWWYRGVPQTVRVKVSQRREEDQGKRGGNEAYFDLIDYRAISQSNWNLFSKLLGLGQGGKEKQTEWIHSVNEVRKRVMHPSSGAVVSFEELQELQGHEQWLRKQLSGVAEEPKS